jgi:hypothetical protein
MTVMTANQRNCFRSFMNPNESSAEKTSVSRMDESEEDQSELQKARDFYWKAHNELVDKLDSRPVTRFDLFLREMF